MHKRRRGLRIVTSDDEDDDPSPTPNPNPSPLVISDDDDPAPPAPNRQSLSPPPPPPTSAFPLNRGDNNREVEQRLALLGLRLRGDWLNSCVATMDGSGRMNAEEKARLCFQRFLFEDMNDCGAGVLPENVDALHNVELEGPFVLQADEIVNISLPMRDRYQDVHPGPKRCLKLLLSDGIQHVSAMEYRSVKDLCVLSPAGLKVVIRNVVVRRGLLMLVPEVCKVLGGLAEGLELARQRLVSEIHKPYRGRRKQPTISLSERASRAAWLTSEVTNNNDQGNSSTANVTHVPPDNGSNTSSAHWFYAESVMNQEPVNAHGPETTTEVFTPLVPRPLHEIALPSVSNPLEDFGAVRNQELSASTRSHVSESSISLASAENGPLMTENNGSSANPLMIDNNRSSVITAFASFSEGGFERRASSSGAIIQEEPLEKIYISSSRVDHDIEDPQFAEDTYPPTLLTREMEVPFTYMTCLLAKWDARDENTSSLQGKVKCFLTGVKRFQFKDRDTYELQVFVDDGSIIFEAIVDHHFVQKMIGHPPKVINASLSSSDEKVLTDVKEKMKRFQRFLSSFEGMVTIELNDRRPLPLICDLTPGCAVADARLLMSRLMSLTASETTAGHFRSHISLSP